MTNKITILVLGTYACGKSTLLNALFGEPLLAAKPTPWTAIPWAISYSNEIEATIHRNPINSRIHSPIKIEVDQFRNYFNNYETDIAKYSMVELKCHIDKCYEKTIFINMPPLSDLLEYAKYIAQI